MHSPALPAAGGSLVVIEIEQPAVVLLTKAITIEPALLRRRGQISTSISQPLRSKEKAATRTLASPALGGGILAATAGVHVAKLPPTLP